MLCVCTVYWVMTVETLCPIQTRTATVTAAAIFAIRVVAMATPRVLVAWTHANTPAELAVNTLVAVIAIKSLALAVHAFLPVTFDTAKAATDITGLCVIGSVATFSITFATMMPNAG